MMLVIIKYCLSAIIIFLLINSVMIAQSNLFPIAVNDKVGYIDSSGKIIIEPQFDTELTNFTYIAKNKTIRGVMFPQNAHFSEGIATVRVGDWFWFISLRYNFALINTQGLAIYNSGNEEIGEFRNGKAVFRKPQKHFQYIYGNKYGFIVKIGELVIPARYQYAGNFSEGLGLVMDKNFYGYVDTTGKLVIKADLIDGYKFSEGLAPAKRDSLFGFINAGGAMIIPEQFVKAWPFSDGLARVYNGNNFSFIDKQGKFISDNKYPAADDFSDGLARVIIDGKAGFINTVGNIEIPAAYGNATSFKDGYAAVEIGGKWGFINKEGKLIIEPKYDLAYEFINGLATVWIDDEMYYINIRGEKVSKVFWYKTTFLWW